MTPEEILQLVSAETQVEQNKIKGRSRMARIVFVRHLYFYLSKRHTGFTLLAIGKLLNRDHTTVINGINSIKNRIATADPSADEIKRIERIVKGMAGIDPHQELLDKYNELEKRYNRVKKELNAMKVMKVEYKNTIPLQYSNRQWGEAV